MRMRDRRRTTIVALAGGVALASGGLAIGSQLGNGAADARSKTNSSAPAQARDAHFGRRGGPGDFSSLADRLGVSEAKLRAALDDLRPSGDPMDGLAAALAKSLNLDEAKVQAELDKLRAAHEKREDAEHAKFEAALAKELGIDAAKVHAAFDKLKPEPGRDRGGPRGDRRDLLADLAKELGVSQDKLRAALDAVRPGGPGGPGGRRGPDGPPPPGAPPPPPGGPGGHHHGGPGGPGGPIADDLAKALGVDAADVRKALDAYEQARRDEFAQKLADKLGIDVDKVKDALPHHP
jgi:ClpA/ClpB-like protein